MPNSFEQHNFHNNPEEDNKEQVPPKDTSEQREQIRLRFPEVYQSPEWKDLPKLDRAQLLLVAEGAKRGTFISGNFTSFLKVVEKMGLAYKRNTENWDMEPIYEVASPEVLSEFYHKLITLPEKAPEDETHRIQGWFLGYPECCTEEYIDPTINRDEITEKHGEKEAEKITNVDYEARQLIESEKPYPKELDYRPPTYTPCSATCPSALSMLRTWKQLLDAADPEAAEQLKQRNWQSEPYLTIHQEDLDQKEEERIQQDKLRFLKESTSDE